MRTVEEILEFARNADSLPDGRPQWLRNFIEGTPENERYYRFLYEFARAVRPAVAVETGTRLGCSAAQLAMGNPGGRVITIDTDPAAKARTDALGLPNLTSICSDSLKAVEVVRAMATDIDLLYIDSDHTFDQACAEYLEYGSLVRPGGAIFFDDIHLNPEMEKFWEMVAAPKAEASFLHLRYGFGMALRL